MTRQTNEKGKIKYWTSAGYLEDCNKRSTKYIYWMTAWIEDETDSTQTYLPNAEDEMD